MLIPKKRFPIKEIILIGFLPSILKIAYYKLKGYRIEKGVHLGLGSVVIGSDVVIREGASIGFLAVVKAEKISIGRFVKIGSTALIDTVRFEIGDDSRINEQVFVGGIKTPESALIIGERAIIMQMSFINPTLPIHIGDDTGIGGHCLLFTHGSWSSVLDGYPVTFAPISIENGVWLPWRVFVMPGVTIGKGAVIGADSTVVKNVPANALAVGSPAKVIKDSVTTPLSEEKKKSIIKDILAEFRKQLIFSGAEVDFKEGESFSLIRTKLKNVSHEIYSFPSKVNSKIIGSNKRSVSLGWGALEGDLVSMHLDLENKTRVGSSDVGEELVSFLSRYGVRFKRLD